MRRASSSTQLPTHVRQRSMPPPMWQTLQPPSPGRQRASTMNDEQDYFTYISTQQPHLIHISSPPPPTSPPAIPEIRLAPPNENWLNPTLTGQSRRNTGHSLAPPSLLSENDAYVSARQSFELAASPSLKPLDIDLVLNETPGLLQMLFPTLQEWSLKTPWSRLSALAAAPFVLVFTVTLPVAELEELKVDDVEMFEEEDGKAFYLSVPVSENDLAKVTTVEQVETKQGWNKQLLMVQCLISPLFIFSILACKLALLKALKV